VLGLTVIMPAPWLQVFHIGVCVNKTTEFTAWSEPSNAYWTPQPGQQRSYLCNS